MKLRGLRKDKQPTFQFKLVSANFPQKIRTFFHKNYCLRHVFYPTPGTGMSPIFFLAFQNDFDKFH